jgi:hypothetical protein
MERTPGRDELFGLEAGCGRGVPLRSNRRSLTSFGMTTLFGDIQGGLPGVRFANSLMKRLDSRRRLALQWGGGSCRRIARGN